MVEYWSEAKIKIKGRKGALSGWKRGHYGVIEMSPPNGGAVAYLIDITRKKAISPFESRPLAFYAADVAEQIRDLFDEPNRGFATHEAWKMAGFYHGCKTTAIGDPIWTWSAEAEAAEAEADGV